MANETKKRLLLSKWREEVGALRAELDDREDEIQTLQSDLEDANEQIAARDSLQDATLLDVKYWMLGVLVHHRPMSDPRVILRKVEEAIG